MKKIIVEINISGQAKIQDVIDSINEIPSVKVNWARSRAGVVRR